MLLLLLCHLPALQSLEINPLMSYNNLFFHQIRDVPTQFPALQSLRSVKISLGKNWSIPFYNWDRIGCFLSLPNISSIYCLHAFIEELDLDENGIGDNDMGENGLEVIQLEECVVDAGVLTALVESTRKLRSLIYRHDETNSGVEFLAGSLGQALQRYTQDTLENLELDFSVDEMHFTEPPGTLGSLRNFAQLKHVTAPMSLLFEPSALELGAVLPRSLASLSLWIDPDWDEAGWELIVIRLLQNKPENVPLLERLHLGGNFDTSLEETIRAACVSGLVDVTFNSLNN
jgi:hypothetical protein